MPIPPRKPPAPYRTPWGARLMARRVGRDPWIAAVLRRLATSPSGIGATIPELAEWLGLPAGRIRILLARARAVGLVRPVCHDGDIRTPQPEGTS